MEFSIKKNVLLSGIQTVQNAITQKSSFPILANVLIEVTASDLSLTATDLDMGISTKIPVIAGNPGALTIPAKKFFDIIKALPENSTVSLVAKKNNSIVIKAGKAQFKIIGLPKEDFPQPPFFEEKDLIEIPQETLKEMLTLTDFAISKDDSRHVLTGILMEVNGGNISIVSTDGRRMAAIKKELTKRTLVDRKVIVSIKTVQEVKRILNDIGDIKIQFSDNQIMFSIENTFIISRLIEGEFPDYNKVIPERSGKVIAVKREAFLNAARRVSILTDQESQAVKINIQKKKMTISKNTPYLGEAKEEVEIEFNGGDDMEIGFNPGYLIDVLKNMEEDRIDFEVNGFNKPGVLRKGEEYVYVVLPMQLAGE